MYLSNMAKAEFTAFLKEALVDALKDPNFKVILKAAFQGNRQEYSTVKEVAEFFKISSQTLYNWVNKGLATKYKISGRSLFKIEEIEKKINDPLSGHGMRDH